MCFLSGESAKGKFPAESVRTMRRISTHTELARVLDTATQRELHPLPHSTQIEHAEYTHDPLSHNSSTHSTQDSLARAAVQASHSDAVTAIVCHTHLFHAHGRECVSALPRLLAKYRPGLPIYLPVPTYKAGRLFALNRAVKPILVPGYTGRGGDEEVRAFVRRCVSLGVMGEGDCVVQVREKPEGESVMEIVKL